MPHRVAGRAEDRYAASARLGDMRSRRGRGKRGPMALPGPLAPQGVPIQRSPRERFDAVVLEAVDRLRPRFGAELEQVELGVEEVPMLPDGWNGRTVPLASAVRAEGRDPPRIVLFRVPISQRSRGIGALQGLVFAVLVEQLADLWDRDVDDIDPHASG